MGIGESLRRLDEALLPPIGRGLAWLTRGRVRRHVVVGAGVVGTTALLAASVWAARLPPSPDTAAPALVRVGVAEGQPVSSYAADSGRELGRMAGEDSSYALVSLKAYLAPERITRLTREVSVHRVYAHAVLADVETDVAEITVRRMPADLLAGMRRVAGTRQGQADSYRRDAKKLSGSSEVERDQRETYRAKADAAAREARAYRSMCSCLYAAVVRGTPAQLHRLAAAEAVRAVDPAPEVTDLRRAVFTPPLPEYPDNPGRSPSATPSGSPSGSPSSGSPSGSPSGSGSPTPTSPSPSGTGSSSPPADSDSSGTGGQPEAGVG